MVAQINNSSQMSTKVFGWGLGVEGQLGNGATQNQAIPTEVKLPSQTKIANISAGGQFSAIVTHEGYVFMFGSNKRGQLGLQQTDSDQVLPKQIPNLKNISIVACGDWHTLALDSSGCCFGTGYNKNGCLGIIDQNNQPLLQTICEFTKINSVNCSMSQISAGRNVSLFIAKDNLQALSAGIKTLHGNISKDDQLFVIPIKILSEYQILNISAGFGSCAAVTQEGLLFTWGSGDSFALGHGNEVSQQTPQLVQFFANQHIQIQQVSTSRGNKHAHMGCIDSNGIGYTWGSGYKAKLGQNDVKDCKLPTQLDFLKNIKIQQILTGGIHSALLAERQVYSFGCGSDGRLGHPELGNHKYLYKEALPKIVEYFTQNKFYVNQIATSYYHMIAAVSFKQ